ncbi:ATP-binding protein [bacterium]|nr:ATP-binding protein [bacterium]
MNEIKNFGTNVVSSDKNNKIINFKAQKLPVKDNAPDEFVSENKKQDKADNIKKYLSDLDRKQKFRQYFSDIVLGAIGLSAIGSLAMYLHSSGLLKRFKLDFKNLSKELSLGEMSLTQTQKDIVQSITSRVENYEEVIKKGGTKGCSILFYGPPGTGKNTFAYGIAKKFNNAKFIEMDISKMNSKWFGESEQNALGLMESVVKYARGHQNEKIFVYIDEIDSVMMRDVGANSKHSNDMLNAFKKGFNKLLEEENIIVMGATNLSIDARKAMLDGKMLDSAMLDRFAQKFLFDLPSKEQILESIGKYYNNSARSMIDESIKNNNDPRWSIIADFLSDRSRGASFRKIKNILGTAGDNTPAGKKVTFKEIINALKMHQHNLNATDYEMQTLIESLKKC